MEKRKELTGRPAAIETLETRATVMLENRVAERTTELTHANAQLRQQFAEMAGYQ